MLKDACVQTIIFVLPHFPKSAKEIRVRCLRTCQTVLQIDQETTYESLVLQLKFVPYNEIKKDYLRTLPLPKRHVLRFKDDERIMEKTYENSKVQTIIAVSPHILDEDTVANVFRDSSMQTLISFTPTESSTRVEQSLKTLIAPEENNLTPFIYKERMDADSSHTHHEQKIKNVMDATVKNLEDRLSRMVKKYGSKPGKYPDKSNTIQSTERLGDSRRNKRYEVAWKCGCNGPQGAAFLVLQQDTQHFQKKETIATRSTPEVNKQCIQYKRSSLPDLLTIRLAGGLQKHKKRLGPCSKFENSFTYPGRKMWQNNQLLVNQEPDYADSYLEQLFPDNSEAQTDQNNEGVTCTPQAIEIPWDLITYQIKEKEEIHHEEAKVKAKLLSPDHLMELTVGNISPGQIDQIRQDILDDPLANDNLPLDDIKSIVLKESGYVHKDSKKEFNPENVPRPRLKPEQVFDPSCERDNEPYMDRMYTYFPDNCNEVGICSSRIEMPWENILVPKKCIIRKKYSLPKKNEACVKKCKCNKCTANKSKADVTKKKFESERHLMDDSDMEKKFGAQGESCRNKKNRHNDKGIRKKCECGRHFIEKEDKVHKVVDKNKVDDKISKVADLNKVDGADKEGKLEIGSSKCGCEYSKNKKNPSKKKTDLSKSENDVAILRNSVPSPNISQTELLKTTPEVEPSTVVPQETNLLNTYRENCDRTKKSPVTGHVSPNIPKLEENKISTFKNRKSRSKTDRITDILESCKKEMEPIKDGINQLRDKIRELNLQDLKIYSDESQISKNSNYQSPCYMSSYASMTGNELTFAYSQAMPMSYPYSSCVPCCPFAMSQLRPPVSPTPPDDAIPKASHRSRSRNKKTSKWTSSSASEEDLPFSEESLLSEKNKTPPHDKLIFDKRKLARDTTDTDSSDFGTSSKSPNRYNSRNVRKKKKDTSSQDKCICSDVGTLHPERRAHSTKDKNRKKNKACYVSIERKVRSDAETTETENSECENIICTETESNQKPGTYNLNEVPRKKSEICCCAKCVGNNDALDQSKENENKITESLNSVVSSEVDDKVARKCDENKSTSQKSSETDNKTQGTKRDEGIQNSYEPLLEEGDNINTSTSVQNSVKSDVSKTANDSIKRCGVQCVKPNYCPKYHQYYPDNDNLDKTGNTLVTKAVEKEVKDACTCTESEDMINIQSQSTQSDSVKSILKNTEPNATDRSTCTACDVIIGENQNTKEESAATNITLCDDNCIKNLAKTEKEGCTTDNCANKMNKSDKIMSVPEITETEKQFEPTEIGHTCICKDIKAKNEAVVEEETKKTKKNKLKYKWCFKCKNPVTKSMQSSNVVMKVDVKQVDQNLEENDQCIKFSCNEQKEKLICDEKIKECQMQIEEKYKNIQEYLCKCQDMLKNDNLINENISETIKDITTTEEKTLLEESKNLKPCNNTMCIPKNSDLKNDKCDIQKCNQNSSKKPEPDQMDTNEPKPRSPNRNDTVGPDNKKQCNSKCISFMEKQNANQAGNLDVDEKPVEDSTYIKSENGEDISAKKPKWVSKIPKRCEASCGSKCVEDYDHCHWNTPKEEEMSQNDSPKKPENDVCKAICNSTGLPKETPKTDSTKQGDVTTCDETNCCSYDTPLCNKYKCQEEGNESGSIKVENKKSDPPKDSSCLCKKQQSGNASPTRVSTSSRNTSPEESSSKRNSKSNESGSIKVENKKSDPPKDSSCLCKKQQSGNATPTRVSTSSLNTSPEESSSKRNSKSNESGSIKVENKKSDPPKDSSCLCKKQQSGNASPTRVSTSSRNTSPEENSSKRNSKSNESGSIKDENKKSDPPKDSSCLCKKQQSGNASSTRVSTSSLNTSPEESSSKRNSKSNESGSIKVENKKSDPPKDSSCLCKKQQSGNASPTRVSTSSRNTSPEESSSKRNSKSNESGSIKVENKNSDPPKDSSCLCKKQQSRNASPTRVSTSSLNTSPEESSSKRNSKSNESGSIKVENKKSDPPKDSSCTCKKQQSGNASPTRVSTSSRNTSPEESSSKRGSKSNESGSIKVENKISDQPKENSCPCKKQQSGNASPIRVGTSSRDTSADGNSSKRSNQFFLENGSKEENQQRITATSTTSSTNKEILKHQDKGSIDYSELSNASSLTVPYCCSTYNAIMNACECSKRSSNYSSTKYFINQLNYSYNSSCQNRKTKNELLNVRYTSLDDTLRRLTKLCDNSSPRKIRNPEDTENMIQAKCSCIPSKRSSYTNTNHENSQEPPTKKYPNNYQGDNELCQNVDRCNEAYKTKKNFDTDKFIYNAGIIPTITNMKQFDVNPNAANNYSRNTCNACCSPITVIEPSTDFMEDNKVPVNQVISDTYRCTACGEATRRQRNPVLYCKPCIIEEDLAFDTNQNNAVNSKFRKKCEASCSPISHNPNNTPESGMLLVRSDEAVSPTDRQTRFTNNSTQTTSDNSNNTTYNSKETENGLPFSKELNTKQTDVRRIFNSEKCNRPDNCACPGKIILEINLRSDNIQTGGTICPNSCKHQKSDPVSNPEVGLNKSEQSGDRKPDSIDKRVENIWPKAIATNYATAVQRRSSHEAGCSAEEQVDNASNLANKNTSHASNTSPSIEQSRQPVDNQFNNEANLETDLASVTSKTRSKSCQLVTCHIRNKEANSKSVRCRCHKDGSVLNADKVVKPTGKTSVTSSMKSKSNQSNVVQPPEENTQLYGDAPRNDEDEMKRSSLVKTSRKGSSSNSFHSKSNQSGQRQNGAYKRGKDFGSKTESCLCPSQQNLGNRLDKDKLVSDTKIIANKRSSSTSNVSRRSNAKSGSNDKNISSKVSKCVCSSQQILENPSDFAKATTSNAPRSSKTNSEQIAANSKNRSNRSSVISSAKSSSKNSLSNNSRNKSNKPKLNEPLVENGNNFAIDLSIAESTKEKCSCKSDTFKNLEKLSNLNQPMVDSLATDEPINLVKKIVGSNLSICCCSMIESRSGEPILENVKDNTSKISLSNSVQSKSNQSTAKAEHNKNVSNNMDSKELGNKHTKCFCPIQKNVANTTNLANTSGKTSRPTEETDNSSAIDLTVPPMKIGSKSNQSNRSASATEATDLSSKKKLCSCHKDQKVASNSSLTPSAQSKSSISTGKQKNEPVVSDRRKDSVGKTGTCHCPKKQVVGNRVDENLVNANDNSAYSNDNISLNSTQSKSNASTTKQKDELVSGDTRKEDTVSKAGSCQCSKKEILGNGVDERQPVNANDNAAQMSDKISLTNSEQSKSNVSAAKQKDERVSGDIENEDMVSKAGSCHCSLENIVGNDADESELNANNNPEENNLAIDLTKSAVPKETCGCPTDQNDADLMKASDETLESGSMQSNRGTTKGNDVGKEDSLKKTDSCCCGNVSAAKQKDERVSGDIENEDMVSKAGSCHCSMENIVGNGADESELVNANNNPKENNLAIDLTKSAVPKETCGCPTDQNDADLMKASDETLESGSMQSNRGTTKGNDVGKEDFVKKIDSCCCGETQDEENYSVNPIENTENANDKISMIDSVNSPETEKGVIVSNTIDNKETLSKFEECGCFTEQNSTTGQEAVLPMEENNLAIDLSLTPSKTRSMSNPSNTTPKACDCENATNVGDFTKPGQRIVLANVKINVSRPNTPESNAETVVTKWGNELDIPTKPPDETKANDVDNTKVITCIKICVQSITKQIDELVSSNKGKETCLCTVEQKPVDNADTVNIKPIDTTEDAPKTNPIEEGNKPASPEIEELSGKSDACVCPSENDTNSAGSNSNPPKTENEEIVSNKINSKEDYSKLDESQHKVENSDLVNNDEARQCYCPGDVPDNRQSVNSKPIDSTEDAPKTKLIEEGNKPASPDIEELSAKPDACVCPLPENIPNEGEIAQTVDTKLESNVEETSPEEDTGSNLVEAGDKSSLTNSVQNNSNPKIEEDEALASNVAKEDINSKPECYCPLQTEEMSLIEALASNVEKEDINAKPGCYCLLQNEEMNLVEADETEKTEKQEIISNKIDNKELSIELDCICPSQQQAKTSDSVEMNEKASSNAPEINELNISTSPTENKKSDNIELSSNPESCVCSINPIDNASIVVTEVEETKAPNKPDLAASPDSCVCPMEKNVENRLDNTTEGKENNTAEDTNSKTKGDEIVPNTIDKADKLGICSCFTPQNGVENTSNLENTIDKTVSPQMDDEELSKLKTCCCKEEKVANVEDSSDLANTNDEMVPPQIEDKELIKPKTCCCKEEDVAIAEKSSDLTNSNDEIVPPQMEDNVAQENEENVAKVENSSDLSNTNDEIAPPQMEDKELSKVKTCCCKEEDVTNTEKSSDLVNSNEEIVPPQMEDNVAQGNEDNVANVENSSDLANTNEEIVASPIVEDVGTNLDTVPPQTEKKDLSKLKACCCTGDNVSNKDVVNPIRPAHRNSSIPINSGTRGSSHVPAYDKTSSSNIIPNEIGEATDIEKRSGKDSIHSNIPVANSVLNKTNTTQTSKEVIVVTSSMMRNKVAACVCPTEIDKISLESKSNRSQQNNEGLNTEAIKDPPNIDEQLNKLLSCCCFPEENMENNINVDKAIKGSLKDIHTPRKKSSRISAKCPETKCKGKAEGSNKDLQHLDSVSNSPADIRTDLPDSKNGSSNIKVDTDSPKIADSPLARNPRPCKCIVPHKDSVDAPVISNQPRLSGDSKSSVKSPLRKSSNATGSVSAKNAIINCGLDNCPTKKCNPDNIEEKNPETTSLSPSVKSSNISSLPVLIRNVPNQSKGESTSSLIKNKPAQDSNSNASKGKCDKSSCPKNRVPDNTSRKSSSSNNSKIPRPPTKEPDDLESTKKTSLVAHIGIKVKNDTKPCTQQDCKIVLGDIQPAENPLSQVQNFDDTPIITQTFDKPGIIVEADPKSCALDNCKVALSHLKKNDSKQKKIDPVIPKSNKFAIIGKDNQKSCTQKNCKVVLGNTQPIIDPPQVKKISDTQKKIEPININVKDDLYSCKQPNCKAVTGSTQPTVDPVSQEKQTDDKVEAKISTSNIQDEPGIQVEYCTQQSCKVIASNIHPTIDQFTKVKKSESKNKKCDEAACMTLKKSAHDKTGATKKYTSQIMADFKGNSHSKQRGSKEMYMEIVSQNSSDGIRLIEDVYDKAYSDKASKTSKTKNDKNVSEEEPK